MSAAYPGGFNTFVPSFDASGHLVVAYSRNPKDFPLNQYVSLTPVKKSLGYFLQITAEQAARVLNTDLAEFVWPDGNDPPTGEWGRESFNFQPYNTIRYVYPFRIGYKANEQADWKVLALHAAFAAQQAMTARATKVITAALNTANYDASHVKTAKNWQNALGVIAGNQLFLNAGTSSNPVLKNTLNAMAQQIQLDTNGVIGRKDLTVVMDPVLASQIAASDEIQDYVKQSPFAMAQVRGDSPSNNGLWGMPDMIYGYRLVIDDTVRVTSRKGAIRAAGYLFDSNKMLMLARPGELTSPAGGPSFSTVHVFAYEEMTVEQRDDPDARRIQGRVVEDFGVNIVAPASGAVCTNATS